MPTPKDGESEQDFVSRCIPMVMDEGTASDQEQASAMCYSMFKEHMQGNKAEKRLKALRAAVHYRAAKAITDAPALRNAEEHACRNCAYYKMMTSADGALTGVCDKYEFESHDDWLCDSWEQKTPEMMEPMPVVVVEGSDAMPMGAEKSIAYGGAVKSLDGGHIGGMLVRFGSPDDTDGDGEYFDATTDYGFRKGEEITTPLWLNHCQPLRTSGGKAIALREPIGQGTLKMVDDGILVDAILYERGKYEKLLDQLGWSSGTADHTIKREKNGKSIHITRWHLGLDASLTPLPADPRNTVVSIKSLGQTAQDLQAEPEAGIPIPAAQATVTASNATTQVQVLTQNAAKTAKEPNEMEVTEFKSIIGDALAPLTERLDKVETALKAEPPVNGNGGTAVTVTRDESDVPFKSIAANAQAVKDYELSGKQRVAPRLKYLLHETEQAWKSWKATGASEGVPTDGGILLDPTLSDTFLMPVHQEGVFTSKVQRMPVSANSNYGWINGIDETSRVAGSRWGGVRGYRIAEGGTKTASKPRFRRLNWELKKYACLVYGTDELLADSAQFATVVNKACAEELSFMLNDDIFEGIGLAGAQGVMNSGALITVTRTTGSSILHSDIVNMYYRMDLNSRATAEWYVSNEASIQLDALYFTGSTSVLSPFVSYDANGVKRLYGRPVNVTEFGQAVNTTGDILFADFSQYLLWQKADIESATSIHVQFITDETAFRFVLRADGQSSQYSALTPFHGSTTTSPWVCLSTAT